MRVAEHDEWRTEEAIFCTVQRSQSKSHSFLSGRSPPPPPSQKYGEGILADKCNGGFFGNNFLIRN